MTVFLTPKPEFFPTGHVRYGKLILSEDDVPTHWGFESTIPILIKMKIEPNTGGRPWDGLLVYGTPVDRSKFIIFTKDSHPEYFI